MPDEKMLHLHPTDMASDDEILQRMNTEWGERRKRISKYSQERQNDVTPLFHTQDDCVEGWTQEKTPW